MTITQPDSTFRLGDNQRGMGTSQGRNEAQNKHLPRYLRTKKTSLGRKVLEGILLAGVTASAIFGGYKLVEYANKRNAEQEYTEPEQEKQAPMPIRTPTRNAPQPRLTETNSQLNATETNIEQILENVAYNEAEETEKINLDYPITFNQATNRGTIVLDAGHGQDNSTKGLYDPGAVSGNFQEATVVLKQALKVKEYLEAKGYKVHLTRDEKSDSLPLGKRNTREADAFVSLHYNAVKSNKANGTEVWYKTAEAKKLAKAIQSRLVKALGTTDRGIKENSTYRVLKGKAPAVIVETGFLSNAGDRNKTLNTYADEQAIANGIHAYMEKEKENSIQRMVKKAVDNYENSRK